MSKYRGSRKNKRPIRKARKDLIEKYYNQLKQSDDLPEPPKQNKSIEYWSKAPQIALIRRWRVLGLSLVDIAQRMSISESRFYVWRKQSARIEEAISETKELRLAKLEQSAMSLSTGYEYQESSIEKDEFGNVIGSKTSTKHKAPDANMLKFMLTNLSDGQYVEKVENTVKADVSLDAQLSKMSTDELKKIAESD